MRERDFKNRISKLLREELEQPEIYYWFSFADDDAGGFKGAVIVKCHGITDGLMKINLMGLNPHGEVMCTEIERQEMVTEDLVNRLLSRDDIEKYCGGAISPKDL